MDKDVHNETLTLQKEASKLLASEMSEIVSVSTMTYCIYQKTAKRRA